MATEQVIIPKVGSRGTFVFKAPFDAKLVNNQEFVVRGVRSIKEILDSEENPSENIYKAYGLTEDDMNDDIKKEIPIIVLSNDAGQYFYVPADRLSSQPLNIGNKYQETMLAINIGYIPLGENLDTVKKLIKDAVEGELNIISTVESLPTSGVVYIEDSKHSEFMKKYKQNPNKKGYYEVRLAELNEKYTKLQEQYKKLEQYIIEKAPPTPQP